VLVHHLLPSNQKEELASSRVEAAAVQGLTTRAVKMIDLTLPSLEQDSEAMERDQLLVAMVNSCTYHIVIPFGIQSRWIWYWAFHDPSLGLILCSYEVLNLPAEYQ